MRTIQIKIGVVEVATVRVPSNEGDDIEVVVEQPDSWAIMDMNIREVRPESSVEAPPPEDQAAGDIDVDQVAGDIDAGPHETAEASQETIEQMAAAVGEKRGRRRRGK